MPSALHYMLSLWYLIALRPVSLSGKTQEIRNSSNEDYSILRRYDGSPLKGENKNLQFQERSFNRSCWVGQSRRQSDVIQSALC